VSGSSTFSNTFQVANQVEALEDEPDLAVAHPRPLRQRQLGHRLIVQRVGAVGRRVEQAENREQRGLAAAEGPAIDTYSPRWISMLMLSSACVSTSSVKNTFFTLSSLISG
jgi:hypothetical protein